MIKTKVTNLILSLVFVTAGVGVLGASHAGESDYTFVNDKGAINTLLDVSVLDSAEGLSKTEIEEKNLALQSDDFLVITFKDLGVWISSSEEFMTKVDGKNKAQTTGLDQLSDLATKAALKRAINKVNDDEGKPYNDKEIEQLLGETLARLKEVLASSDGLRRIDERVDRDGIFTNNQFIVANYYFRISRSAILDEIRPSPIVLTFEGPEIDPSKYSNDTHYVARYTDQQFPITKTDADDEAKWKPGFQKAIFALAKQAFTEVVVAVNKGLRYPQQKPAINQLIAEYTAQGQDKYQLITTNYEILKKEVWPKGSLRPRNTKDTLKLSVYFYFDREKIKDLVIPPERTVALDVDDSTVAQSAPSGSSAVFVGVYKDYKIEVPQGLESKKEARQVALDKVRKSFRKDALEQAAADISKRLAQPINEQAMAKALSAASKDESAYIGESRWIGQPMVVTRGTYSTTPETLRLSAYVTVNRDALQNLLIEDRVITIVGKYRTYVELFWNVPDKDINPEVVQTLIATVEDDLRTEGYEVVEFERIKGDLVTLLKNSTEGEEELYSEDELVRFKANLALRNIDSRFENGKRILADYADLVFGVTINTIEVIGNQTNVRVTIDATYFSQGEWMKLASSDSAIKMPYVEGSQDHLISTVKRAAGNALAGVKPKVQSQLALRTDREELNVTQDREFTVVFKSSTKEHFGKIKKRLSQGSKWGYKRADFKSRSVYVSFKGNIDSLSDMVQMYLEGAGLDPGMGEYSSGVNRILFSE